MKCDNGIKFLIKYNKKKKKIIKIIVTRHEGFEVILFLKLRRIRRFDRFYMAFLFFKLKTNESAMYRRKWKNDTHKRLGVIL